MINIGKLVNVKKTYLISLKSYNYNNAGRLVEYTKSNISGFGSSCNQNILPNEAFNADKWTLGYMYNHDGVREQMRFFKLKIG
ncbi:MAG: hypothetical protein KIT33_07305 [Candidatus Kapabacteria bacterium]|nr:hypothetical protein [Ignavibacteriota bacterium]MCW5884761.1 hypothetical protein [Candidatus Kapabacteria bacterium]